MEQKLSFPADRPDEEVVARVGKAHHNMTRPALYEEAVRRQEGLLANSGAFAVRTGLFTGRSPGDKYIVREASSADDVWWGKVNQPLSEERFAGLYQRLLDYFVRREVFVEDLYACADRDYRLPLRVISESAWHSLFARTLFIRPDRGDLNGFVPGFTILHAPGFHALPTIDGTRSDVVIAIDFGRRLIVVGGTGYAGEIKKGVFSALSYILPRKGVLSMHCSANEGKTDDVALFFGLSGTGKTSLGTDPERSIIGDDEHGWNDKGVFNIEGGLYAKVINLSSKAEPQIWSATHRFGAILENVVIDPVTRQLDFADASLTENTRSAFPIEFISNADPDGRSGHPRNVIFLTADAFGVLPPVARLGRAQALYHFLSGYSAKVAGTERGLSAEPKATFSTCFAAPFLTRPPSIYARLLADKIARHRVQCWLVNTGWIGGAYGVGHRIPIGYSRSIIHAILDGSLGNVAYQPDPVFAIDVPEQCPGVPADILRPRQTWGQPDEYDRQAKLLAEHFRQNFEQYASEVAPEIREAEPRL